jgi:hypothetical protein
VQSQADAMSEVPRSLADLQTRVSELAAATARARETITSARRMTERLTEAVDRFESRMGTLERGLERAGSVLDHRVLDAVPPALRRMHEDVAPRIGHVRRAQLRVRAVVAPLRRARPLPRTDGAQGS